MVLAAEKKNRSWNTNSCGENVFWQKLSFHSPRCLIKILSFFRSRRRQAATFLHGAERVAQMTQKALQLALNVSNEAWEDATVDNLVTYLDNYT